MKREDYNRFLKVAPQELDSRYFLSWIETDPHTPYYFAKVKKNHTLFVEGLFKNVPMHQGIFVDIFPFDRIPDNRRLMKVQHEPGQVPELLPNWKRSLALEALPPL